jgi:hypothetical protein
MTQTTREAYVFFICTLVPQTDQRSNLRKDWQATLATVQPMTS